MREPELPFFIQRDDGVPFPGSTPVDHPGGPATLSRLSVAADRRRLEAWLGDHDLPIAVASPPGPLAVTLAREGRAITIQ